MGRGGCGGVALGNYLICVWQTVRSSCICSAIFAFARISDSSVSRICMHRLVFFRDPSVACTGTLALSSANQCSLNKDRIARGVVLGRNRGGAGGPARAQGPLLQDLNFFLFPASTGAYTGTLASLAARSSWRGLKQGPYSVA